MPTSQLTPSQIKLLIEVVDKDGLYMTAENEDDARRLDELILVELDWEEGNCKILPYDSVRAIAATLAATPVVVAPLDTPQPVSGGVEAAAVLAELVARIDAEDWISKAATGEALAAIDLDCIEGDLAAARAALKDFNPAALASSPESETAGESVVLAEVFWCTNPSHGDECRLLCTSEDALHIPSPAIPLGPVRLTIQSTQGEAKA